MKYLCKFYPSKFILALSRMAYCLRQRRLTSWLHDLAMKVKMREAELGWYAKPGCF